MNPLLDKNTLQFGAIPFDKIKVENFIPALKEVIDKANHSIEKMKNSKDKPTFKNTIEYLEKVQSEVDFVKLTVTESSLNQPSKPDCHPSINTSSNPCS